MLLKINTYDTSLRKIMCENNYYACVNSPKLAFSKCNSLGNLQRCKKLLL